MPLKNSWPAWRGGDRAFVFASGMAAIRAALAIFAAGDHIVISDQIYGGTFRIVYQYFKDRGLEFTAVDTRDLAAVEKAIQPNTKAIYFEPVTNPLLQVTPVSGIAQLAHEHGILAITDNTFLSPYLLRPLKYGADLVVHSATKYLAGHNDILGGIVVVKDPVLADFYFQYTITVGDTMSAFDSWLLTRSLKTLPLRMQHTASAKKIVSFLEQTPHVEKVLYPGKAGMISFYLDSDEEVDRVLKSVKLITFAESLGGAESLLTIPYYQTHDDVAEDQRLRLGITPRLLRLSVGLENADDLIADLAQALGE